MVRHYLHQIVHHFKYFEEQMNFPVVSPLSHFPLVGLSSPERHLHGLLADVQERQKTKKKSSEIEKEIIFSHKPHQMWVQIDQFKHQFSIPDTHESDVFALISLDQSYKLLNSAISGKFVGLEFDVHRYFREFDKKLFQSRYFFAIGFNCASQGSKLQLDVCLEGRQIFIIKIIYFFVDTTGSLQTVIMMDYQHAVLCLADIQFDHVTMFDCLFKGLDGILGFNSCSTSMCNFYYLSTIHCLFKERGFKVPMRTVQECGEEKQQDADSQVGGSYEQDGDDYHCCRINLVNFNIVTYKYQQKIENIVLFLNIKISSISKIVKVGTNSDENLGLLDRRLNILHLKCCFLFYFLKVLFDFQKVVGLKTCENKVIKCRHLGKEECESVLEAIYVAYTHCDYVNFENAYNHFKNNSKFTLELRKMVCGISKKGWTDQEDQIIRIMMENDQEGTVRWIDVSSAILQQTGRHRTGKQCRERWQHQLKPSIVRNQWNQAEVTTLFQKQSEFGNKWASIANSLPGRTDNAVKNYFYSSVRRVLTTINTHLGKQRSQKQFKSIRYFSSDYLSKLMAVVDGNFDKRVRLTSPEALNIAKNILSKITKLVLNQAFGNGNPVDKYLDNMILTMQQFRKKCIKRKQVEMLQEENLRQAEPHKQIKQKTSYRDTMSKQSQELQKDGENYTCCHSTSAINYLVQNQDLQSNKTLKLSKNQAQDHILSLQTQKRDVKMNQIDSGCVQKSHLKMQQIMDDQSKAPVWSILEGQCFFNQEEESVLFCDYYWRQSRDINIFEMPFSYPSEHCFGQRYDIAQEISTKKMLQASMALDECCIRQKKYLPIQLTNL